MAHASDTELERVRAAKPEAEKIFRALLGEVSIGITRVGEAYGIKVNLTVEPDQAIELPSSVNGIPVCIEVTGPIKKRTKPRA